MLKKGCISTHAAVKPYTENRAGASPWKRDTMEKEKAVQKKHRILIVDDEPAVRDTLEALLLKDYDLHFAENGARALEKAAETMPDVILLDVMMPGMDGFEVCRRLRDDRILGQIPVVMVTALDGRDSLLEGIRSGADEFIKKPFDRHELRLRIGMITRLNRYGKLLQAREEKERLKRWLGQLERTDAIAIAVLAHDFNNILYPIQSFTEMAMKSLPAASEERQYLREVVTAADRAKSLVNHLLTFSREEPCSVKEPVAVHRVVREVCTLLKASMPASVCLQYNVDDTCGTVLADSAQLHRVVMNLGLNALHAMGDKGGELAVTLTREGGNVKLTVRDTGCGMNPKTVQRIFDPCYTTKKKGEGTGLGLFVVHGIVEGFGGRVEVNSEEGRGTEFQIFLPVLDPPPAAPEIPPPKKTLQGDERVLLVDDDVQVLATIQTLLEGRGYRVTALSDGPAAWAAFSSAPRNFDLVLTDNSMPRMTGLQLSENIRALRNDIPVIICSGQGGLHSGAGEAKAGAVNFLMKPVPLKRLLSTVRSMLDAAGAQNGEGAASGRKVPGDTVARPAPRINFTQEEAHDATRTCCG